GMRGWTTGRGPVFDAIVRNLLRLFGSSFAFVGLLRDGMIEVVGLKGEPGFEKLAERLPVPLDARTHVGKAMLAGRTLQIAPIVGNPEAPPFTEQSARDFQYNSQMSTPFTPHRAGLLHSTTRVLLALRCPPRPFSPLKTPACSTSCASRCSSRPPPPTCSRSSAARRSTCRQCSTRSRSQRPGCAMRITHGYSDAKAKPTAGPRATAIPKTSTRESGTISRSSGTRGADR